VKKREAGGVRLRRWRHSLRHSLKRRLVAVFLLLALATTGIFLLGTQRLLQSGWQTFAKPLVADYVDRLAADIGSPPKVERALALTQRLPIAVRIDGPTVHFDSHPGRKDGNGNAGWQNRHDGLDRSWGLERTTADGHVIRFGLTAPPDSEKPRYIGWATLTALLLLTAAAYAAVRRLLQPLQGITAGVQAYGRGDFSASIRTRKNDELGDLAQQINRMATSLQGMLDAKRALLLAISHELRSPLTRARVNAELLDDTAERTALLRDLGEMRDLISTLLESERLAQGHAALQAEPVNLAALAREAAAESFLPLTLQLDERLAPVQADPMRLKLLLRNLLNNVQGHAAQATQPAVLFLRVEPDGRTALGVRDHGPGVDDAQLARLGEAFHRPDSARTRASGGVGLGLHLCRLVAQAHGGELRVQHAHPGLEVAMLWAGKTAPA
jgi:signal transduction histidine kinase